MWFLEGECFDLLKFDEICFYIINDVIEYNFLVIFVCGNIIYYFFLGIKVLVFYGYLIGKWGEKSSVIDDYFFICGWFDMYCI